MATEQSRRSFLAALSSAGTMGFIGTSTSIAQEAPPETTRIRLIQIPSICMAAQFMAEELLRREGFADVQYIKKPGPKGIETALASGEADINMHFNARLIMRVDAGDPIVILAGGHPGCFELFGTDRVRAIRDLKGKTVAVLEPEGGQHAFIAIMAAHVGLDPRKDVKTTLVDQCCKRSLSEKKNSSRLRIVKNACTGCVPRSRQAAWGFLLRSVQNRWQAAALASWSFAL